MDGSLVGGRRLLSGGATQRRCRLRGRGRGCRVGRWYRVGRWCRGRLGVVAAAAGGENQAKECGRDSKAVTGQTCFHGVFLECNHGKQCRQARTFHGAPAQGRESNRGSRALCCTTWSPEGNCAPPTSQNRSNGLVSGQLAAQPRGKLIQQEHGYENCHQNCAHMGILVHVVAPFQLLADAPRAHQTDNRGHAHVAIQDV